MAYLGVFVYSRKIWGYNTGVQQEVWGYNEFN